MTCVQLLCLTAHSGLPLFCRGSTRPLPFPLLGPLNAAHMFAAAQGVTLCDCQAEDGGRVAWKRFHDSVTVIGVCASRDGVAGVTSDLWLRRLLDYTWDCMVLVLGLEEVTRPRSVERLKRDLRACYRLIDACLEGAAWGGMGDLTHCVDCLPVQPSRPLQDGLDAFVTAADSEFGCLLVNGRVVVATDKWWLLSPQEVTLLVALAGTAGAGVSAADWPVFLPRGSPTVPHRLLLLRLLPGATLCVLCGPVPPLGRALREMAPKVWRPLLGHLHSCLLLKDRCLPASVPLGRDVLALLLINQRRSRSVSTILPAYRPPGAPKPTRRQQLLRLFYAFATTRYFRAGEEEEGEPFSRGFPHQPLQCYLVTEECKCFALQDGQHQLFLLAAASAPTFALRTLASQTLADIIATTGF